MSIQLGMIGGGVMGEALLSRLLAQEIYRPEQVIVSEPQAQRREVLAERYKILVTPDNQAASETPILLLAIKPQLFEVVTQPLSPRVGQLVLSILAGLPLRRLEAAFPGQPVVRSMPNTPATVGAGITAIAAGSQAQHEHLALARQIFAAVGEVVEVPESLLDAVTGLSGSGPGYLAVIVEAMIDGGVAVGLPRPIATQLAVQTLRGTAELLQAQNLHPAQLKDQVTSPGGTTIAGIAQLEQAGVRSALIEAIRAACRRSQELGQ
ncbi:MAG: pyrroline-5-carboxylate reductase [Pegethrix bostrychoides GSE-TBD4-15B]|uniref:Pyrroline-5-carboxylate reductase n=1 Tax=Pegethrix bostrychoides GSE-TBD4-15B TaxID=2839662 RepID=A0A951U3J7_9CYAN|nr:pyrroline-5-carboxylate reductase [Pegethrix bostrychoides GSE-TBD4-15B]